MKHSSKYFFLTVILLACVAAAQVSTGTPPFGSFGGGPFDTVNLGNLNVHFAIPVLHKVGRGVPFSYDLSYDSSIWYQATIAGVVQWTPSADWGWTSNSNAVIGRVTSVTTSKATSGKFCDGQFAVQTIYTTTYAYLDSRRRSHPFPGSTQKTTIQGGVCNSTTYGPGFTATATDGSGYSITVTVTPVTGVTTFTVVTRTGVTVYNGNGTYIDTNGNELAVNSSTGQFFDTLSSTTAVLTLSGSGTPASPITYTYSAPSASATYTMNFTQYTVATSFGVSGVAEYGRTSNALVSSIQLPDGSEYQLTYETTPGSCTPLSGTYASNCVTGRIYQVTLPTGGTIQYSYSGGSEGIYSDGSTAGLTRSLTATTTAPSQSWSYSRAIVSGTPGPGSTWTTTVVDPNSNNTVINFAEDAATSTATTAATYSLYETQRKVYQGSVSSSSCSASITNNCLLLTTTACYNATYSGCSTATVTSPITQADRYAQPAGGTSRLSEALYNGYGLVTDDKEYTYGATTGSAPGITKLIRETAIAYASLGNGIVGKPSSVTVYDWTSGTQIKLASTTYAYDGSGVTGTTGTPQHISISGARGNLTTLTNSTSSTAALSKSFTYYDTGTPYVVTDVNGAQTTYVYSSAANPYNSSLTASCGNSFATSVNEPLSLSRSMQWNCLGGIAEQATDENGQVVKTGYTDAEFWRPANVYDQQNNETTITYTGETAVETALQNFNGGSSVSDSRTTVDSFGRAIFSQRLQGPSAGSYDTSEIDYNSMGQPYRSTMPYSTTASPSTGNSTAPATTTTNDALGRVATTTDADSGSVTYTYANNDVLQQVSGGQTFQKQFEYDGLGRLTSVCEISSTLPGVGTCAQGTSQTGYWTKYTYDALGRLLTVTQNAQATSGSQQTRSFTYDWLGRMLTESNPETGNSGANGVVHYTYDSISPCADGTNYSYPGSLVQKKDNAGNYTCYAYDALHRLTKAGNSSVTNTILREFVYDSETTYPTGVSVSNGNTRMVEAKTINTSSLSVNVTDEFFSYSARGETTDLYELTPHSGSGVYYHTTAAYWPTGMLKTLSGIPSVPTINYGANGTGLDGEGRITQVSASSGASPVTGVTYSTSSTTNPLGALTTVTFGSADSDSFSYDPNTGRMATYTFSVNTKTDAGTLTWNPNGTLTKLVINDQIPGTADSRTCTYGYDDVHRVSNVTCGTFWVQNFTYDAFGNITKNVPVGDGGGSFLPTYWTSPPTNQFTALTGATPSYDANGNLLTDNLNSYAWDPNWGTMTTVSTGSTTVTATYDALGRMVENNAGGSYTEFVYGPTGAKLAKVTGTTLIKAFVALPGGAKAIYNPSGLAYYRHSDWLGSSRLTSTASRSMYFSSAYAPFGEQYDTAGSARCLVYRPGSRHRGQLVRLPGPPSKFQPRPLDFAGPCGSCCRSIDQSAKLEPLRLCEQQPFWR